ncbi:MAG: alpha/beta hydrolase [Micropepsaceae bacterium]
MPNLTLTSYPTERPLQAAYGALKDIASFVGATVRPPVAPLLENVPRGDGHTVLVLPGFMTGDWATRSLINWLRDAGYDARGWGGGTNWGPTPAALTRCAALVDEANRRTGQKVSLIGRSLGGLFARELAKDAPAKIHRVITLATPIRFPIKTPLSPFAEAMSASFDSAFTARMPGLQNNPPVPVTAFYSRSDGIVPWRACLVEEGAGAENIEVDSPHTIMGSHPVAMRIIAERLAVKTG